MDAISYKQKEYLYSYFRSKPPELNLHLHKYYEFLYFISGDATYIVEDNLYKIHPGDILLTRDVYKRQSKRCATIHSWGDGNERIRQKFIPQGVQRNQWTAWNWNSFNHSSNVQRYTGKLPCAIFWYTMCKGDDNYRVWRY